MHTYPALAEIAINLPFGVTVTSTGTRIGLHPNTQNVPGTNPKTQMTNPILELTNVGCSKAPGQPIFEHVSFTVNERDVVVLQGKSGSG